MAQLDSTVPGLDEKISLNLIVLPMDFGAAKKTVTMVSAKVSKNGRQTDSRSTNGATMLHHGDDPCLSSTIHKSKDSDNERSETEGQKDPATSHMEDVIGISIGESQSHMKSPRTPAIEKSQALERSKDYFVDVPEPDEPTASPKPDGLGSQAVEVPGRSSQQRLPHFRGEEVDSPQPGAGQQETMIQRSETSRSFLKETLATSRKRASSGSAIIAENIRRLVPDVSLQPWLTDAQNKLNTRSVKWVTSSPSDRDFSSPRRQSSVPITRLSPRADQDKPHVGEKVAEEPRKDASNSESPALELESSHTTLHPPNLRRATSDNSLFLRRQNTASTSGSGQWDHVHEQVNSRMKAIRDSFQDSGFRLPKLPNLPNLSIKPFAPDPPQNGEDDIALSGKTSSLEKELTDTTLENFNEFEPTNSRGRDLQVSTQFRATDGPPKSGHPILADALSDLYGDVVVLGGYRGSILRSAKPPHRQLWVPVKVGLNIRRVDLEVGLTPEDEETMEENVIPSGVLSHIGPIDICRRLLKKLYKCSNAQTGKLRVHNYGYDWRLSPHILSRKFIEFLENLKCNRPDTLKPRGALIIAHSLGGLIARHAVNQRPDLFAGVLYAGVPQHCVNILGPMRNGDEVLLSSKVLTAQVNFTIRTSYLLLPESGICFFDRETKKRYDVDFFDAKTWDLYRLSPCISPPLIPKPREKPMSIIDSVSNTVSSSLASLTSPVRRLSWASASGTATRNATSSESKVLDAAQTARQEAAHITHAVSPPPPGLEPTMDAHQITRAPTTATACTIPRSAAMEYLQRTLAEVLRFKQELLCKEALRTQNKYPPAAVLYSRNTPTVSGARVSGREGIKYCDAYDDLAFANGDGVVLVRAAMLPEGYRVVKNGLVKSDRGHVGLLGDLEGVGKCLRALIDGREKGIGMGSKS